jgi:hypothetical protein
MNQQFVGSFDAAVLQMQDDLEVRLASPSVKWRQCGTGDHCPAVVAFLVQFCGLSTRTYA